MQSFKRKFLGKCQEIQRIYVFIPLLFIFGVLILIYSRSQLLNQDGSLNPDEADLWLAAGQSKSLPIPFERYAGSTYGPLWPLLLGLIPRAYFASPWLTIHLTAIVLLALILAIFAGILVRCVGGILAVGSWLTMLTVLAIGGIPRQLDFFSLSTELLPVLLLSLSWSLVFIPRLPREGFLLTAAFCAGLAPIAKIQSVPLVIVTVVVIILEWKKCSETSTVRAIVLTISLTAAPGILLMMTALVTRNFENWFTEFFSLPFSYTFGSGTQRSGNSALERLNLGAKAIAIQPTLSLLLLFAIAITVRHRCESSARRRFMLTASALVAGYICVASPGTGFQHYLYFWIAATVLAVAVATPSGRTFPPISLDAKWTLTSISIFIIFVAVPISIQRPIIGIPSIRITGVKAVLPNPEFQSAISQHCPKLSTAVLWGWNPEILVQSFLAPATRFMINDLAPDRMSDWNDRVLKDFSSAMVRSDVKCVIESGPYRSEFISDGELRIAGFQLVAQVGRQKLWSRRLV